MTGVADARSRYEVPDGVYLLSHSVGCLPGAARAALERHYLDHWAELGGDAWGPWLDAVQRFRDELALLLNAAAVEICPQATVSSGLTKFLGALPPARSTRRVLMHASAFPSLGFAVHALAPLGFELVLIDEAQPPDDPDVWTRHIDRNVTALLVTHVHSNTGIVSPVRELAGLARRHDVLCIVDIAQSVGVLPIDLADWQADVVLGSCVKWLCGGPGAGFLWVREGLESMLKPIDVGWFSHQDPFEWNIRDFRYADGALKFWGGTPGVAPFVAAAAAIGNARDLGIGTIRAHNLALQQRLRRSLEPAGICAEPLERCGGTTCLTSDAADRIAAALGASGCRFDQRGATLRLSPHIYNTEDEIDTVARTIGKASDVDARYGIAAIGMIAPRC